VFVAIWGTCVLHFSDYLTTIFQRMSVIVGFGMRIDGSRLMQGVWYNENVLLQLARLVVAKVTKIRRFNSQCSHL